MILLARERVNDCLHYFQEKFQNVECRLVAHNVPRGNGRIRLFVHSVLSE